MEVRWGEGERKCVRRYTPSLSKKVRLLSLLDTTHAATLALDTCLLQNRAPHNVYVENQ